MRFEDRTDAGTRLAEALFEYNKCADCVVLALPRGGVVLGRIVADELGLPLDLVIPRKIGAQHHEEYAIGAVTESGAEVWNEEEKSAADPVWLKEEVRRERDEAKRRRALYLKNRQRIPLVGKIVLIVDDGMATGLTMRAAILEVKAEKPKKIIIAVPVAPSDTTAEMNKLVDRVIVLSEPTFFTAIGAFYDSFDQVEDESVIRLLQTK